MLHILLRPHLFPQMCCWFISCLHLKNNCTCMHGRVHNTSIYLFMQNLDTFLSSCKCLFWNYIFKILYNSHNLNFPLHLHSIDTILKTWFSLLKVEVYWWCLEIIFLVNDGTITKLSFEHLMENCTLVRYRRYIRAIHAPHKQALESWFNGYLMKECFRRM